MPPMNREATDVAALNDRAYPVHILRHVDRGDIGDVPLDFRIHLMDGECDRLGRREREIVIVDRGAVEVVDVIAATRAGELLHEVDGRSSVVADQVSPGIVECENLGIQF
jgi:hypothetical protein